MTFQLDRGITHSGRIVDASGAAIAGATVRLEAWMELQQAKLIVVPGHGVYPKVSGHIDENRLKIQTETDAEGNFQLTHLPKDMVVTLIVSHPEYYPGRIYADTSDRRQAVKAKINIHLNDSTIQLESSPELYVAITTESGEIPDEDLVAFVTQEKRDKYGAKRFEVPVQNGRVDLRSVMPNLEPYLIFVQPWPASGYCHQQLAVEIGEATSGKIAEIVLKKGVLVHCRCKAEENGIPVAGMRINYEPTDLTDKDEFGRNTLFAETDEQGQAFLVVPPIEGTLTARNTLANQLIGFVTMTHTRNAEVSPQTRERFVKSISPAASDKQIDVEFLFQSTSPIKLVCQDVLVQRETEESDI